MSIVLMLIPVLIDMVDTTHALSGIISLMAFAASAGVIQWLFNPSTNQVGHSGAVPQFQVSFQSMGNNMQGHRHLEDGTGEGAICLLALGALLRKEILADITIAPHTVVYMFIMPILAGLAQQMKMTYVDRALVGFGTSRLNWACLQTTVMFGAFIIDVFQRLPHWSFYVVATVGVLLRFGFEWRWVATNCVSQKWFGDYQGMVRSNVPGWSWLCDKMLLPFGLNKELARRVLPPTYYVKDGGISPLVGPTSIPEEFLKQPWFLKNTTTDASRDNHVFAQPQAAIAHTLKSQTNARKRYVLQPSWPFQQALIDGHKFHIRTHVLLVGRRERSCLQVFWQNEGLCRLAADPYVEDSLERKRQLSNFRVSAQSLFHQRKLSKEQSLVKFEVPQKIQMILTDVFRVAKRVSLHGGELLAGLEDSQMILGADFLVDNNGRCWLLEFNKEPFFHPRFFHPDIWHDMYLPMRLTAIEIASKPIIEGRPSKACGGWIELEV